MSETVIRLRLAGLGHTPSFKNGKEIIRIKGRPAITTKQSRKSWMAHAIFKLRQQCQALELPPRLTEKRPTCQISDRMERLAHERSLAVSLKVTVGISDLSSADIDGALATVSDCLTKAGGIPDDAPRYVKSMSVSWQPVERGGEFAEIVIGLD